MLMMMTNCPVFISKWFWCSSTCEISLDLFCLICRGPDLAQMELFLLLFLLKAASTSHPCAEVNVWDLYNLLSLLIIILRCFIPQPTRRYPILYIPYPSNPLIAPQCHIHLRRLFWYLAHRLVGFQLILQSGPAIHCVWPEAWIWATLPRDLWALLINSWLQLCCLDKRTRSGTGKLHSLQRTFCRLPRTLWTTRRPSGCFWLLRG